MTYTGRTPVTIAHDLPAAVATPKTDVWIRTPHGDEDLIQTAVRVGDNVVMTVGGAWDPSRSFTIPADSRVSTRVY